MISLPPSDSDLHAYVDHQLSEQDRRLLEHYLASHPQVAARVQAWQQDAQHLRAALGGALLQPANPALDPVQIRARLKQRSLRRLASAAVLLVAVGVGGLSGWQARELTLAGSSVLPMTDALQAYRLFAEQGMLPADFKVQGNQSMQAWLDRYFTPASPVPDLPGAGFRAVSGRLLSTEQGPAAMVLYEDRAGRKVSFYIRPPGPQNKLLPPGSRREGPLQAQYWSGQGYNYAMVGPAEIPL